MYAECRELRLASLNVYKFEVYELLVGSIANRPFIITGIFRYGLTCLMPPLVAKF